MLEFVEALEAEDSDSSDTDQEREPMEVEPPPQGGEGKSSWRGQSRGKKGPAEDPQQEEGAEDGGATPRVLKAQRVTFQAPPEGGGLGTGRGSGRNSGHIPCSADNPPGTPPGQTQQSGTPESSTGPQTQEIMAQLQAAEAAGLK